MFPRLNRNILGRLLPNLMSQTIRSLAINEKVQGSDYVLRIAVDPFTESDCKVKVEQGGVRVVAKRGEKTGISDWSHEMDIVVPLPPGVKKDTVQTKFEQGAIIVTGITK
ncbi:uncharacterized protein LOC124367249 isoform X2 [Homalodisca vitripennis]|uniref:uncharacterized protein LOC124367249 isoform X2 n=1 Tax=Homalodisca vitripennis TaxID=197043 RepID=UPI001EEA70F8|nr:uncharacterized protein LOC124367249 isoform X2 [Homalodisca vitripennis]